MKINFEKLLLLPARWDHRTGWRWIFSGKKILNYENQCYSLAW